MPIAVKKLKQTCLNLKFRQNMKAPPPKAVTSTSKTRSSTLYPPFRCLESPVAQVDPTDKVEALSIGKKTNANPSTTQTNRRNKPGRSKITKAEATPFWTTIAPGSVLRANTPKQAQNAKVAIDANVQFAPIHLSPTECILAQEWPSCFSLESRTVNFWVKSLFMGIVFVQEIHWDVSSR